MTTLFLANVGSSDLQLADGRRLSPPREAGRRLLDQGPEALSELRLPILVPSLREALAASGSPAIDRLVLFATDQSDPEYRYTDTLHLAELARRWLAHAPEFRERLASVEVDTLDGISPAPYDEAFAVYAGRVAALDGDGVTACYVAVTGGTAAMNMALLFHAVRVFGPRCHAIYKRPDPDQPAFPLDIGRQLRQSVARQTVVAALTRQDFGTALALMEAGGGYAADLLALTRYAQQRLYFDFDSARQSLSRAIASGHRRPALRDLALAATRDLDRLRARDPAARLAELTHNAAVAYQARRYVAFLGRVYRFQDAVLRWVMETVCELPTDLDKSQRAATQAGWQAGIESHPELLAYLQEKEVGEGEPLDHHIIALPTMLAVATFVQRENRRADGTPYLDQGAQGPFYGAIEMLKKLSPLVSLRHRTIIAHDFEGVSQEILARCYAGDPADDMYTILTKLGIGAGPNPFEQTAKVLADAVQGMV